MRVVHLSSEAVPFSKTGGLADVAAALPGAQAALGIEASIITPWYGPLSALPEDAVDLGTVAVDMPFAGATARVFACWRDNAASYLIHRPEYFDREHLYGPPGESYFDNPQRFIFFSRAALALADAHISPDVIHCHDWQAALAPALVKHRAMAMDTFPACVTTIHNLAFQGICSEEMATAAGLPPQAFTLHEGEFFGSFNLLKAGLAASRAITTVSPTYAREILTPEFGCGLEAFLLSNAHKLTGIANGIDMETWNPAGDPHLPAVFAGDNLSGKARVKRALLKESGLGGGNASRPLAGFVGRLTGQKGADIIARAAPELLDMGFHLVLLGRGDAEIEQELEDLAKTHPDRVSLTLAYDEALAHRIIAGSDFFIMPSRFEPCGLTQLYAMRYGTIPVATKVGGLADTITPHPDKEATGLHMTSPSPEALAKSMRQALKLKANQKQWRTIRQRAMNQDLSWKVPAGEYAELYERVVGKG